MRTQPPHERRNFRRGPGSYLSYISLPVTTVVQWFYWASPVEILVFAIPTGYMFTSSGFPLLNRVYPINSSS